jgi:hypothetical protein
LPVMKDLLLSSSLHRISLLICDYLYPSVES